MYDDSIKLFEHPEQDSIAVCVYCEQDGLLSLGERIYERFDQAYMNGYNWDALIRFYVQQTDPDLAQEVEADPEAGMFAAYMSHSPENLVKMQRYESLIRKLVQDEATLMAFIEDHYEEIEWD